MTKQNKVLVPFGLNYASAIQGLCEPTDDIEDFHKDPDSYDLVLFTGGADVSPEYYGETSPKHYCSTNIERDITETRIFNRAYKNKIKMAGICRGIQFLTVICGGRLIHHLNNHSGSYHEFGCSKDNHIIRVNSLHHQMCIPPKDGYIIGWSQTRKSDMYLGDKDEPVKWPGPEVEAVLIPDKLCVGVQYHPELMRNDTEGYKWFYQLISRFLSMDLELFVTLYTKGESHHAHSHFIN